ncbi:MAG: tRNA (adenosine(37)-N6)-dimethylallyltransferase MiaA, partial [Ferruginibacter sp.]|nr:tRNA (adenosine(37)-N6)-dimethylallyltransferase MiaA [Ferruginibacter sp.]
TVEKIFLQNNIAVMCGGTGLYIKAFTDGLDAIAETDEAVKNEISKNYEQQGIEWLKHQIRELDPLFWQEGEIKNPHRLMRALEVVITTGKSIIAQQKKIKKQRDFNIIKIGLDVPRDILYERINNRVEVMRENGLEDEVKKLLPFKTLNALQTVGYRELFNYFEGQISLESAFVLIKQNTRHYAKRQITWFKKEEEIQWLEPNKIMEVIEKLAITN